MSQYVTLIGLSFTALGSVFVAAQVLLARRRLSDNLTLAEREANRLKRQSTIDFYMSTIGESNDVALDAARRLG